MVKKIGLALEGGGLKGSYQIGAYYAFKKCHIKISGFVGTSIGSFNACLLASGQEKELLDFWQTLEPEKLLDINQEFADYINGKQGTIKALKGLNSTIITTLKQKGLSTSKIRNLAENIIDKERLYKSKKYFGLVTVKLHDFEPIYIDKDKIPKAKLVDYLVASCSLPIFKLTPIIDNNIYIDGGFFDNCPIKMLIDQNYDTVYEIRINGIGRHRNVAKKNTKVITIRPSKNICNILELNREKIRENILLGYYDTLRVLRNYDGYKYTFTYTHNIIIKFLTRKISKNYMSRIKHFFKVKTDKEAVLKALEYCMDYCNINHYQIYSVTSALKNIQQNYLNKLKDKNIIFNFIKKLRIFKPYNIIRIA